MTTPTAAPERMMTKRKEFVKMTKVRIWSGWKRVPKKEKRNKTRRKRRHLRRRMTARSAKTPDVRPEKEIVMDRRRIVVDDGL